MQLNELFTEMAEALRTKEETTDKISAESFPQRIKDLKVLDTTDATATANDVVGGKIFYANGKRGVGSIIDNGRLEYTPSNEEQIIPAGKTSGGIVKAINSEEVIITPTTEEQIKEGLFNKVKVEGIKTQDLMIIPKTEEQKFIGLFKNVIVEPVDGGLDTSDATATAGDIAKDKTAYVNGEKITGTLEVVKDITSEMTSFSFAESKTIEEVNLSDISNSSSLSSAFKNCTNLKKVSLKKAQKLSFVTYMFQDCTSLETVEIEDANNLLSVSFMFNNCSKLETAPQMNFSNVTVCQNVFNGCTNLKNVPVYNIPKPDTIYRMFYNCSNLTDESLNNILLTCINAIKIASSGRTLNHIGLSQDQATRCQSLSNYQAFLDAGWTTGY